MAATAAWAHTSAHADRRSDSTRAERRKQRSDDTIVALHYQLARAKAEGALDAIVLADASGVVVAGAGAWVVCEELAAYAPLFAAEAGNDGLPPRVATLREGCEVRAMTAAGQPMLLCALGGKGERARVTDATSNGVVRILETT